MEQEELSERIDSLEQSIDKLSNRLRTIEDKINGTGGVIYVDENISG